MPSPEKIRELLTTAGWSQSHAARVLGVRPSSFRRWLVPRSAASARNISKSHWRALRSAVGR